MIYVNGRTQADQYYHGSECDNFPVWFEEFGIRPENLTFGCIQCQNCDDENDKQCQDKQSCRKRTVDKAAEPSELFSRDIVTDMLPPCAYFLPFEKQLFASGICFFIFFIIRLYDSLNKMVPYNVCLSQLNLADSIYALERSA